MEFVCDECGVSFCNNQNRLRHIRTKHQGLKRMDNEKKKRKRDSQEIAHAKIAKEDITPDEDIMPEECTPAEDIIPEESTDNVTEDKPANTRFKNHMKTRLKELANRYGLSDTYDSRNIKDAIVEKFNQPTQVLCFKFVRGSPWREDVKIMVEECFEELIRACIINNSLVIVEHASKKRYKEQELTGWMIDNEVKLMQQEGKTFGQYVLDYLGKDCFEIICIGPLSVSDVFNEAKLSV